MPLLVFVPIITMRLVAEENRSGTLESVFTTDVDAGNFVLGKYVAAVFMWVALWLPTLMYAWITSRYGSVDVGALGSSYVGVFGIGLYYIAIGLLGSTLASNQIMAALLTFVGLGTLFVIGIGQSVTEGLLSELCAYVSVWGHMADFSRHRRHALSRVRHLGRDRRAHRRYRGSERTEEGAVGGSFWRAWLAAIVAIAFMANYVAFRHYERIDWTKGQLFTLSQRSRQVLSTLDDDLNMYVFLAQSEEDFADLNQLIEQYKAASSRVHVERVDPDRDAARYQLLAERFGIGSVQTDMGMLASVPIVIEKGDARRTLQRDDLITADFATFGDADSQKVNVESERAVTGAIADLIADRTTTVCSTEGHGEWSLTHNNDRSLTPIETELQWERIGLRTVSAPYSEQSLEGCDAVFIVGPQRPYSDHEVSAIMAYFEGGGSLLLALDPMLDRDGIKPTGFERALKSLDIEVGDDIVVELSERHLLSPSPVDAFIVSSFGAHPTTQAIAAVGGGVATSLVQSVCANEGASTEHSVADPINLADLRFVVFDFGYSAIAIDRKPRRSQTDRQRSKRAGLPRGRTRSTRTQCRRRQPTKLHGRLIVIGDADWLKNAFLQQPQYSNLDLFDAWAGWLTKREALVGIAPRQTNLRAVLMTEGDIMNVAIRVIVLLPLAFVLIAAAVWWSRRR
ncbi:MAG: Gldg family protein [Polyangiales bacterium]